MTNIRNASEVRELIALACFELNFERGGKSIRLDMPEAVDLLLGTWAVESNGGKWLKQLNGGPALSAWQIEKPTFLDVINRCRMEHREVLGMTAKDSKDISPGDYYLIEKNHKLAIQIARLKYYLSPGSIPLTVEGRAEYWKKYYNTYLGSGTVAKYLSKYQTYVLC